ncbi:MAG TPA: LLM class flavin-dependent oxidoreductase [Micromonosporaceae bacterium]|nr:LLM class flavin-dependent oxidoreductase [Micromonosporaceae bacterium]
MGTRGFTVLRGGVRDVAAMAKTAERLGFHSVWSPEFYTRSAIVTLAAMAYSTASCRIGSAIAYAVGRSPLILATEARSLDELCGGRLVLGLGTGTTRMMQTWHGVDPSGPASRMEELIPLLRRIWRLHEEPVKHKGRFYQMDLTATAEVTAPVRERIPVFTAGVNARMIEVAGRVSDGFLGHPLFSPRYYDEVVRPSIAKGAAKTGRDPSTVETAAVLICSVADDEEQARREVAAQLAFYAAPKTYSGVLEMSGFAAAGEKIRAAFAARDFGAMAAAVPDEMVDAMAVAGPPAQVQAKLQQWSAAVDEVIMYPPSFGLTDERCGEVAAGLLSVQAAREPAVSIAPHADRSPAGDR